MGRSPCCDKVGLKKGPWTPEEDRKLMSYIQQHGHGSWRALPPKAGLKRCGKSCRLRWTNYLRPDIKRGKFSSQEEQTIIQLHALLGNRWSTIASHLSKRTDNEIKNYWNTHIKKRLNKMGIDSVTHKAKNNVLVGVGRPKDMANLSHIAQWESTRLEAEARIVRESKFFMNPYHSLFVNKFTTTRSSSMSTLPSPRPPCLDILKAWQATKPKKDILSTIINGGSLESPTSILNFSENMLVSSPIVGLIHKSSSMDANYVGNHGAHTNNYQDEHGKGIMVTSPHIDDNIMEVDESLRFPNFLEDFADLPPLPSSISCMASNTPSSIPDDADNKINYWSDILNVVNSPTDTTNFWVALHA